MKKLNCVLGVLLLAAVLCSCKGTGESVQSTTAETTAQTTAQTTTAQTTAQPTTVPVTTQEATTVPSTTVPETDYISLYAEFLQTVHDNPEDYVQLSGTGTSDVNYNDIEGNDFAIGDVTGDGTDDLVIWFTNTFTAAMYSGVWTVDAGTDTVVEYGKLGAISNFYSNGVVKVDASHNQGPGDDIWPYSLCRYDESQQKYVYFASVCCYEEELDTSGSYYKAENDADDDGVIYVWEDEESGETEYLTLEEYNTRVEEYTPEGSIIELNTYKLTDENIAAFE